MLSFITQPLHRAQKIKMPCESILASLARQNQCPSRFSDTCITGAYGDLKTIRAGIEQLDFKPYVR